LLVKKSVNPLQVELWHEKDNNESLTEEVVVLREENERLRKRLERILFFVDSGVKEFEVSVKREAGRLEHLLLSLKNEEKARGEKQ